MAVLSLLLIALICGAILGFASIRFRIEGNPLVDQIDSILPQTQCGQCGYPGCRPYATAIVNDRVAINRCPPGGQATINQLADLLDVESIALDAEHGQEAEVKTVAYIEEALCIGCTKCILACPVDAILGAAKQMHTVITSECTGCDLCVDPCPVDCIEMLPVANELNRHPWPIPNKASDNYRAHLITSDRASA